MIDGGGRWWMMMDNDEESICFLIAKFIMNNDVFCKELVSHYVKNDVHVTVIAGGTTL